MSVTFRYPAFDRGGAKGGMRVPFLSRGARSRRHQETRSYVEIAASYADRAQQWQDLKELWRRLVFTI